MGACFSSAQDAQEVKESEKIDEQLRTTAQQVTNEVRLLLLGTGESGKSTIARQMKIIHKDGFTAEERQEYRGHIISNVLHSVKMLSLEFNKLHLEFDNDVSRVRTAIEYFDHVFRKLLQILCTFQHLRKVGTQLLNRM